MRLNNHMIQWVRNSFLAVNAVYILALAIYLVCRLIFGDGFWWLGLINEFAWLLFILLPLTFGHALIARNKLILAGNIIFFGIVLIWLGPIYLPKNLSKPTNPTLKILTFNVWGYNDRLEEVDAWLQQSDPDVVLLQEISTGLADGREQSINQSFPYRSSQASAVREFGSLILSRYPILSELSLPDEDNQSQNRITIDANGHIITIYNVHMPQPLGQSRLPLSHESFFARSILSYDNKERNEQIEQLLQRIEMEEYPVIIAGDFNMSDQTAIYQEISEVIGDSFREAGLGSGRSWPVRILNEISPLIPPLLRVDYIWHSHHFQAIEAYLGPELGSDHLPLFKKSPPAPI